MKVKSNFKRFNLSFLMVLFVLITNSTIAQEKKSVDSNDFKIIVEKTDNGIKLQSVQGCAWKELSFKLNDYQPQAVNEFGMTELDKTPAKQDANLADFLFTIIKTDKGIELKGMEGTAWSELSFSLAENKPQVIDKQGMTILN